MQENDRTTALFADAWTLYDDAIRATDAKQDPQRGGKGVGRHQTGYRRADFGPDGTGTPKDGARLSAGIRRLSREGEAFRLLRTRYSERISELHGDCFYDGNCEPEDEMALLVRETADYIRDAEALAST